VNYKYETKVTKVPHVHLSWLTIY